MEDTGTMITEEMQLINYFKKVFECLFNLSITTENKLYLSIDCQIADIVVTDETKEEVINATSNFINGSKEIDLHVNHGKTKYMVV